MIRNVIETTPVAVWRHRCEECGRIIPAGARYLRQVNADGNQLWTFKAHIDCAALGVEYRNTYHLWDAYDWAPMYDLVEPLYLEAWRGHYPHAVCRLERTMGI